MRITLWIAAAATLALVAPIASAGPLEDECRELARSRQSGCEMDKDLDGEWQLTTRLLVGSGAKPAVQAVERRFCQQIVGRGERGRVVRWNDLPGELAGGARMEWTCATPAVSSGPAAPRLR